jgi:hypothetical protein
LSHLALADHKQLSVFFIADDGDPRPRRLDAAYTLLRNATELVRDAATIEDDDGRALRWWNGKLNDRRDRLFQFDETDVHEKYVYELYKIATNWGTHCHITGVLKSTHIGAIGFDDKIEVRRVSDKGIDEALAIWLSGFFPMQFTCLEQLAKRHPDEFTEVMPMLFEYAELAGRAAKRLLGNINLKAPEHST